MKIDRKMNTVIRYKRDEDQPNSHCPSKFLFKVVRGVASPLKNPTPGELRDAWELASASGLKGARAFHIGGNRAFPCVVAVFDRGRACRAGVQFIGQKQTFRNVETVRAFRTVLQFLGRKCTFYRRRNRYSRSNCSSIRMTCPQHQWKKIARAKNKVTAKNKDLDGPTGRMCHKLRHKIRI
jgi:hypothetical protein